MVVFDFDGPVFDARKAASRALEQTVTDFGLGAPTVAFAQLPLLEAESLIAACYPALDSKALSGAVAFYRKRLADEEEGITVAADVREVLKSMHQKGIPTAVHSARREDNLRRQLKRLQLEGLFKVAASGLQRIAKDCGTQPSALVFIGDSLLDRSAADEAGAIYYHAGWTGEPTVLSTDDVILEHPRRLFELVDALQIPITTRAPTDLPQDLMQAARSRTLVFCAGAGVSVDSGIGGWKEHYGSVLDKLRAVGLTKSLQLVDALQLVCSQRARSVFDEFKISFQKTVEPNHYHYALLRSGVPRVWTLNYDTLFEKAAAVGAGTAIVRNDHDLENQFRERQLLVKMNGDFESAEWDDGLKWNLVFLRQHFDLIERDRPEIWRAFEDDFRHSCILFVGVSFEDPGMRRIVSVARAKIPRTRRAHYMLARLPRDPLARAAAHLHARDLERLDIHTLFFERFEHIRSFVEDVCLAAIRPIVGLSGSAVQVDAAGNYDPSQRLPGGEFDVATITRCVEELGRSLASRGFRVTSGAAQAVGERFVAAAFESNQTLARCYVRKKSQRFARRTAPIIVVPEDDLGAMREVFVGELHTLVALGGVALDGKLGVVEEISRALERQVPVVLIPQAGGVIQERYGELKSKIRDAYRDPKLRDEVSRLNEEVKTVSAAELPSSAARSFPTGLERCCACMQGDAHPYIPPIAGRPWRRVSFTQ